MRGVDERAAKRACGGEEQRADTGLGEAGRAAAVADVAAELAYSVRSIVSRITDQDRSRGAGEIKPVRKV